MTTKLGPLPPSLRRIVAGWIEAGRLTKPPATEEKIAAVFISGGPAAIFYLDADGEIWVLSLGEEKFTRVGDGPDKLRIIVAAAEHRPELAEWLPRRPAGAHDCPQCAGGGWWLPPLPRIACDKCHGLGWSVPE